MRTSQITDNDVMVWSNRGFGANATNGVDVVADGAYAPGDATLNTVLDGRNAWETWGGTSRSTPVAAGATALVYQAYEKAHGGAVPAGFYSTAQDILKSTVEGPRVRRQRPGLGFDRRRQGGGGCPRQPCDRVADGVAGR